MRPRRWDIDERGRGAGDARALLPGLAELGHAMDASAWVAEQPEAHLLPHLRRSCESLPLELVAARTLPDATFEVDLRWQGQPDRIEKVREAVFALLGSMAESATYVRQARVAPAAEPGPQLTFDIVTGMTAEDTKDSPFAPHGHTLRFRVSDIFGT